MLVGVQYIEGSDWEEHSIRRDQAVGGAQY